MNIKDDKEEKREAEEGYGRTVKYLGLFGGAHGASLLLGMVRNKLTTLLLGAHGLSIIAYFNRTVQMFSDCTNMSLSFSAIRRMSDVYENCDAEEVKHSVRVVRSLALFTGIVGMALMLMLSPFVSDMLFNGDASFERMMMLSPAVLFMAVTGGELAILRGVKQLGRVATYTFAMSLISLLVAIPLYYIFGFTGIFIAIFLNAFTQMAVILYLSVPLYAYRVNPFSLRLLRDGLGMVKLGVGYMYATMLTSLAIWLLCVLLSKYGENTTVGFFMACFTLINLLPGVLFAALDSDYYPRLSGVSSNLKVRNEMVNRQVEVQQLVQSPLLLAFVVALPIVYPLFYDGEFLVAVPMTQLAMVGMFMRSMAYPISFLPLAKNDTTAYFLQETIYNISFVVLIIAGYLLFGLLGIGLGVAVVYTLDFLVVYGISHIRYGYRPSRNALCYLMLQMPLFFFSLLLSLLFKQGMAYWTAGVACVLVSSGISLYMLQKHARMLDSILKRFKKKR